MLERAFTSHTTADGLTIGMGALWHDGRLCQVDLMGEGGEPAWTHRVPLAWNSAPRAPDARADALWADLGERLDGNPGKHAVEMTQGGTVFQHKVWAALMAIPCGEVRTYKEIAQSIGVPDGARAVASACASNPIALIVPCHRVVGAQGKLGGYRWGVALKRRQLEMEGANR